MTRTEIVAELARTCQIERMLNKIGGKTETPENLQDFADDIYLYLLERDDGEIERLYERGELGYWLLKYIRLQIFSKSSPYYGKYKKRNDREERLDYQEIVRRFGNIPDYR